MKKKTIKLTESAKLDMKKKTWSSTYPILCAFLLYLLSDFHSTHDDYKTRLVLKNRDSKGEDTGAAAAGTAAYDIGQIFTAIDIMKNVEVQANIGPMFSEQASFLISLGNKSQVPIFTSSAPCPSLAWTRSPYIIRATKNDSSQVNTRIHYRSVISPLATDDQIVAELYKLMTMQKRVFIVHMLSPFSSRLFSITEQKETTTRDYAWIITDGITDELNSTYLSAIESMLGVKGVKPYVPKTNELDDFTAQYKRRNNPRGRAQDLDIFGLHTYDSHMELSIAAEKANLGSPKYQESNISRNSNDLVGFGISDAVPKLIQDISSTTFKGLARNFNLVVDGQLQSPSYEIIKIVGPGARGIGYWRKKTENFKHLNFTSAKPTLGLTIWSGDASSSPKGWAIPTNGKTSNSTEGQGFCIDVFDAVMKALTYGLTYEFIPFVGDYGDLIHLVRHGNYDAAVGDTEVVGDRYQYVDFAQPYAEFGEDVYTSYKSTKVEGYRIDVFNAVMASLPIGYLVWVLEHQINKYFRHPFWHQLGMTLWFAFSAYVFSHREMVVAT